MQKWYYNCLRSIKYTFGSGEIIYYIFCFILEKQEVEAGWIT